MARISIGRAVTALIDQELVAVSGDQPGEGSALFTEQAVDLERRQEQVARCEEEAAAVEDRLRAWSEHLRRLEDDLELCERESNS